MIDGYTQYPHRRPLPCSDCEDRRQKPNDCNEYPLLTENEDTKPYQAGDLDGETEVEVISPSVVTGLTWNGKPQRLRKTSRRSLMFTVGGIPPPIVLPALDNWRVIDRYLRFILYFLCKQTLLIHASVYQKYNDHSMIPDGSLLTKLQPMYVCLPHA